MVDAIERGFPQREIADASYRFQQAVDAREKTIVGVNDYVQDDADQVEVLYIDEGAAEQQLASLDRVKNTRDRGRVTRALDRLRQAAGTSENLMPPIIEAVRAYATVGEMCDVLRAAWGEYEEVPTI
jgi:methylmalonyl-CoA mutase N-terminal domain/subunit